MWSESSLNKLYKSAVGAFPETEKRQHIIDSVNISQLEWIPFVGMKTLFLRGNAQDEYTPLILFKNVKYYPEKKNGMVEIISSDTKQKYFLETLSGSNNVLLRCSCGDYYWRFNYYNNLDKSNYGKVRKPYEEGSYRANPKEMPGMCKHLMALGKTLKDFGLLDDLRF